MGVRERRERQRESLRQEILDAARELFLAEGYDAVSMRRIADKIEYSPTTIYLYFRDKADLFVHLCEETFARLLEVHSKIAETEGDPVMMLRRGLRAYVDFGLEHPNHYRITFIVPLPPAEVAAEQGAFPTGDASFDFLRRAVTACVESGAFKPCDVETVSQGLWAVVHGITALLICHADFPWVDRDTFIDSTIGTMLDGLAT